MVVVVVGAVQRARVGFVVEVLSVLRTGADLECLSCECHWVDNDSDQKSHDEDTAEPHNIAVDVGVAVGNVFRA